MIVTTRNNVDVLIDEEDLGLWNAYRWYAYSTDGSTVLRVQTKRDASEGKKTTKYLSRLILNAPQGQEVDHKNGDPLDNRRSNLRLATRQQQCRNMPKVKANATSRYKGVCWFAAKKRWLARIFVDGKPIYLGYHRSEIDAARSYDDAAKRIFGEFARTNDV